MSRRPLFIVISALVMTLAACSGAGGSGSSSDGDSTTITALMVGNPARRLGWACECGEQLPESLQCSCTRSYELDDGLLKKR